MEQLDQLTSNVTTLIARYEQLKAENAMLREANQSQRAEILRSHADLEELEKQYSRLRLASAVVGTPDERDAARKRLTQLIARIDHVLEILKQ